VFELLLECTVWVVWNVARSRVSESVRLLRVNAKLGYSRVSLFRLQRVKAAMMLVRALV
jgi:hypothetical protein